MWDTSTCTSFAGLQVGYATKNTECTVNVQRIFRYETACPQPQSVIYNKVWAIVHYVLPGTASALRGVLCPL